MLSHEIPSSIYIDITWYHIAPIQMSITKVNISMMYVLFPHVWLHHSLKWIWLSAIIWLKTSTRGEFPPGGTGVPVTDFSIVGALGLNTPRLNKKRWPSVAVKSLDRLYVQPKFGLMTPQSIFWLLGIDTTSCWRDWRHPSFRLQGCWWS